MPPGFPDKHSGPNSFFGNGDKWLIPGEKALTSATATPCVISVGKTEAQRHEKFPETQELGFGSVQSSGLDWFHLDLAKCCHTGQVKSWKEVFCEDRFSPHPFSFLNVSNLSGREIVGLANSLFPADPSLRLFYSGS